MKTIRIIFFLCVYHSNEFMESKVQLRSNKTFWEYYDKTVKEKKTAIDQSFDPWHSIFLIIICYLINNNTKLVVNREQ